MPQRNVPIYTFFHCFYHFFFVASLFSRLAQHIKRINWYTKSIIKCPFQLNPSLLTHTFRYKISQSQICFSVELKKSSDISGNEHFLCFSHTFHGRHFWSLLARGRDQGGSEKLTNLHAFNGCFIKKKSYSCILFESKADMLLITDGYGTLISDQMSSITVL